MYYIKIAVILVVVVGVGYFIYMKYVKGEDPQLPENLSNINMPDIDTVFGRAEAALRKTDYDAAMACFRKVIEENKDPNQVALAHFKLGKCYEEAKRYQEAIAAYRSAIRKYPDHELANKYQKALDQLELQYE